MSGWFSNWARAVRERLLAASARLEQKIDEDRRDREFIRDLKRRLNDDEGLDPSDRIEREADRFAAGLTNQERYRDFLLEEKNELAASDHPDRDQLLDEISWRLTRVEDRIYRQSISREGFAENGKWARFDYVDHDGVASAREITRWERRGAYIVGFDRRKKGERTFRQDRIENWQAG